MVIQLLYCRRNSNNTFQTYDMGSWKGSNLSTHLEVGQQNGIDLNWLPCWCNYNQGSTFQNELAISTIVIQTAA